MCGPCCISTNMSVENDTLVERLYSFEHNSSQTHIRFADCLHSLFHKLSRPCCHTISLHASLFTSSVLKSLSQVLLDLSWLLVSTCLYVAFSYRDVHYMSWLLYRLCCFLADFRFAPVAPTPTVRGFAATHRYAGLTLPGGPGYRHSIHKV